MLRTAADAARPDCMAFDDVPVLARSPIAWMATSPMAFEIPSASRPMP
jgi:hypothetical protein